MQISWLGEACFKISHKDHTILIEPYDKDLGLKPPRAKADILIAGNPKSSGISSVSGDYFLVSGPGEYEVGGIFVYGITIGAGNEQKIIYRLEVEEVSIAHLNNLDRKLNDKELEELQNIDILLIPVGGGAALDAGKAVEVISDIEPRLVIPMQYKIEGLKKNLDPIEKFIKAMGVKNSTPAEKINIKKKELPAEDTEVAILSPASN